MTRLIVRRATAEDLARFSDMANKPTTLAWVGELEGRIIALGGLARVNSRWFAFCDLTAEARPFKMAMMRTAKRVMAEAKRQGFKFVYAQIDHNEPGSVAWITSLGFELDPRSGELYRWSGK